MTTRRGVLKLAGMATLGVAAGCRSDKTRPAAAPAGERLMVELRDGLAVVDTASGRSILPPSTAVAGPEWTVIAQAQPDGTATQLTIRDATTGAATSSGSLRDRLQPRAVSPDGRLVALTTPVDGAGRERTTIVVADSSGERTRLDLAGNIVPEAFSIDGATLFVLDYLPPTAPDRYRVRAINLKSAQIGPLSTRLKKPVPSGAEEEMRGEGRQSVYAPRQRILFTLYTHQPDHLHTRDLVAGARAGRPHVHAFVHSLNLAEGWAYCIDLPAPFGEHAAAGHAIALEPNGNRLVVANGPGGVAAVIDPAGLTVQSVVRFAPMPTGEAAAALSGNRLLVGAGLQLRAVPLDRSTTAAEWTYETPVRGLAVARDGRQVYVGQTDQVLRQGLAGIRVVGRTAIRGLVRVHRHVS